MSIYKIYFGVWHCHFGLANMLSNLKQAWI